MPVYRDTDNYRQGSLSTCTMYWYDDVWRHGMIYSYGRTHTLLMEKRKNWVREEVNLIWISKPTEHTKYDTCLNMIYVLIDKLRSGEIWTNTISRLSIYNILPTVLSSLTNFVLLVTILLKYILIDIVKQIEITILWMCAIIYITMLLFYG